MARDSLDRAETASIGAGGAAAQRSPSLLPSNAATTVSSTQLLNGSSNALHASPGQDDYDSTLKAVDTLLLEDDLSHASPATARLATSLSVALLILASATSANLLPRVARRHKHPVALWSTSLIEATALSIPALALGFSHRHSLSHAHSHRRAQQSSIPQQRNTPATVALLAILIILSNSLAISQSISLEPRTWQALETAAPSLLIALSPLFSSQLARVEDITLYIASAAASAVAFALVGLPATSAGILAALAKLPVDALRIALLKQSLDHDRGLVAVAASYLLSFVGSTATLLVQIIFSNVTIKDISRALARSTVLFHALATAAVFATTIVTLSDFRNPTTPMLTVHARNLILVALFAFGKGALPVRGHWLQMAVVLSFACLVIFTLDNELRSTVTRKPRPTWAHPRQSVGTMSTRKRTAIALLPLAPMSLYALSSRLPASAGLSSACDLLPASVRNSQFFCSSAGSTRVSSAPVSNTVDLVFAYYDEPLPMFKEHLDAIRRLDFVWQRRDTVVVYNKGPRPESEIRDGLDLRPTDEVVRLANLGREGATYLSHITRRYNSTALATFEDELDPDEHAGSLLADHTFFMQPHLAWSWVAKPRLDTVGPDTGFAHFGPFVKSNCGHDAKVDGNFDLVRDLWSIFRGEICSPEGQLTAWSAQFVVSRTRILANPYDRYAKILDLLLAPEGHWIHSYWGPNGSGTPDNPAAGHAVERAWPFIFGCVDPKMADECTDTVSDRLKCQCLDHS